MQKVTNAELMRLFTACARDHGWELVDYELHTVNKFGEYTYRMWIKKDEDSDDS